MKEYRVNKLALAQVIGAAKKYTDAKVFFELIGEEPELDASIVIMEQLLRRIEANDDGNRVAGIPVSG